MKGYIISLYKWIHVVRNVGDYKILFAEKCVSLANTYKNMLVLYLTNYYYIFH